MPNSFCKLFNPLPNINPPRYTFKIGEGFTYQNFRTISYGGNLGVSQNINTFGNQFGKYSFIGNYKLYLGSTSFPYTYHTPGINYLVNFHSWGNYNAFFGLRERKTDDNLYLLDENGESIGQAPCPDCDIKDAVITWGTEHNETPNRLIFQSLNGVFTNAPIGGPFPPSQVARERATILSNGNLGLGVQNPNAHLHIMPDADNINADQLKIEDAGGNTQFVVKSNGNVGIGGENNTNFKLEIEGNSLFNGNLQIENTNNTSSNDNILKVNNNLSDNIFKIQNDGKIFYTSQQNNGSEDKVIFMKPNGELFATNTSNYQSWGLNGNNFPSNTNGVYLIGTNASSLSDNRLNFVVNGQTFMNVLGTSSNQNGSVEFRKSVSMGGWSPSNIALANELFTLTLKTRSNPMVNNVNNHGTLRCINHNNIDMLNVTNSEVGILNNMFQFKSGELITDGSIYPLQDGSFDLGDDNLIASWNSVSSYNWNTASDKRLKDEINNLDNNYIAKILKLNPVSYKYPHIKNKNELFYGFIAQEVKEIFPNGIVRGSETDSSFLSINYLNIIPVLTKGIQEQQLMIDSLKEKVALLIAANQTKVNIPEENQKEVLNLMPILFQNHPNPFHGITYIDYFLPINSQNAFIRIVDNNGKLIKAFELNKTGYGQVELDCSNLASGTYHYTLLVNSQMIDTKSMIVVANH
jgi:hypothetical protein